MEDKLLKRRHRSIDYLRLIRCLGLESGFMDYFYYEHPRLMSVRRQARYFLQFKKVDIYATDIFIKQNDIKDHYGLLKALDGRIEDCYL